jgi:hypothetical protein
MEQEFNESDRIFNGDQSPEQNLEDLNIVNPMQEDIRMSYSGKKDENSFNKGSEIQQKLQN